MGILDTIKDVVTMVQKADNIDLVKHVLALQAQAQEMLEENRGLKEHVRELEAALQMAKTLTFEPPFYFAPNDPTPLCPRCWEVDRRVVHVVSLFKGGKDRWDCFQCKQVYLIQH